MLAQLGVILIVFLSAAEAWACASCGCTLSSDWEDASQKSFKFDLRYDYIDQNQLRSGVSTIAPVAASQLFNNGNPQEVEVDTRNVYVTAAAEYSIDPSWKISAIAPYIIRYHDTLGTASNGITAGPGGGEYISNTANFGDIKLIGRFQGFSPQHDFGVLLGIKLPTGSFSLTGTSTDPTAPGPAPIDRGLQPGTGTTDLIFGAYYSKALDKNWDFFTEALYQTALNSVDQYRPGDGVNLNFGFRYFWLDYLIPQIQINARYVQTDSGANADTFSTGGTLIYISPGVTVPFGSGFETYAFVQLPLYQFLLGVQLAPTSTVSIGARYTF